MRDCLSRLGKMKANFPSALGLATGAAKCKEREENETRTHTGQLPPPPQSGASTNSAISPEEVPSTGLEPAHLSAHAPETCASTNSASWAFQSFKELSGKRDSNSRPRPWQGRALPTELLPHFFKMREVAQKVLPVESGAKVMLKWK